MAGANADGSSGDGRDDRERTDLQALRVTREESRAVLDHQVALLNGILTRTMWTVRLAGVALGLVVSVVGIAGPSTLFDAGMAVLVPAFVGVCSLVGCVFVGLGTYSITRMQFGVDDSFREEVIAGSYGEREWLRDLLAAYDAWSGEMRRMNRRNTTYLLVAQLLLLAGITFLVSAVVLTVMTSYL